MHKSILPLLLFVSFWACKKETPISPPEPTLKGHWIAHYEFAPNGTKDYSKPDFLLAFEPSDGFMLNSDGLGRAVWYGHEGHKDFFWKEQSDTLRIRAFDFLGNLNTHYCFYSDLTLDSLTFINPIGKRYKMYKVK
ncbi:MAG: hypothetical protein N4A46_00075 [Schleiferiaceae bacterium]|nr:hypothetical protein [Schleiferiaceae bacterium]